MIKSGDQFIAGRSGGVVGAVVPWRGSMAGVAPAHIFQAAGTEHLRVGGVACKVSYVPNDADLAFFPILGACQPTKLWQTKIGKCHVESTPSTAFRAGFPTPLGRYPTSFSRWATCQVTGTAAARWCRMARLWACYCRLTCTPARGLPYPQR